MHHRNLLLLTLAIPVAAQGMHSSCANCAAWNKPHQPFRIYGNTYYVGTDGLSSILITSEGGHILIDGALPESAPLIVADIRSLGFRIEDVKLIVNSHAHFDHAGGIAELQRLSQPDISTWQRIGHFYLALTVVGSLPNLLQSAISAPLATPIMA